MTRHGSCDQASIQATADKLSKFENKVPQVGAALECYPSDILTK